MLETGHCLDTGRARADNQDNLIVVKGPAEGTWLLAVADGVGGLPGGAAASDTALATMESCGPRLHRPLADCAETGIATANAAVIARAAETGVTSGFHHRRHRRRARERSETLHAGDSRAYLMRDGLSAAHPGPLAVGEAVRDGRLSPRRHAATRSGTRSTRALGVGPEVDVERSEPQQLQRGDALLVCSDGLHGLLDSDEIAAFLGQGGSAEERAKSLVAAANRAGGTDNIAVIVALVL